MMPTYPIAKRNDVNAKLRLLMFGIATAAIGFASSAGSQTRHRTQESSSSTYSPELGTGRDALRQVVQDQCVVNWSQHHTPAPCERVFLADSKTGNSGYAVLA